MVLLTVVAATLMRMVASGGPLTIVALSSTDHHMVTLHLVSVVEVVVDRWDPIDYWCPSGLGTNRGLPILSMWC